jgi:hypothetical protein
MPEFCSCGAQLPPDALFCHKCGKPQRHIEMPMETEEHSEPAPPPVPAAKPEPAPLNFRNRVAMRTAFTSAVLASLLSWIPILNFVLWLGAGYFASFFYRRRTGVLLNVKAGLRLGWITGIMMFAIVAVFFTSFIVLFNVSGGVEIFQAQFRNSADPNVIEALKALQNAPAVALLLLQLFVFITCLSMVGGALGAKMTRGD